jgi:beta-galactosidase
VATAYSRRNFLFQSYWADTPMVHLYGHTWPVRWGAEGEEKMVKAYSNCDAAELFVNGNSAGVKRRNSQDFPAAALRWMTTLATGENTRRVVATKDGKTVTDEITFLYQAESRVVEMCNGRAEISLTRNDRVSVVGVSTTGIKPVFCTIA